MMTLTTYQSIVLALFLLCTINPTESRYREKDDRRRLKSTTLYGPTSTMTSTQNLCSSDRDRKLVCHCTPDDPHVKAQKADCWVFSHELSKKDPIWLAFHTQTTIEHLKFIVQTTGALSYVPTDVLMMLKNLKRLSIEYGNVPDLNHYAFANLTELRNLSVTKSHVKLLHQYAFANHPNLEEINLEKNEIIDIDKEAFVNMTNLHRLILDENNITFLYPDVFMALGRLDALSLDTNDIRDLSREIFKGLGNLRILSLSDNNLSQIRDTVFAELWSLQELYLDHNNIEKIYERAFDGLNNLRKLDLQHNKLKVLERGVFTGVPAILSLNLNSNFLETLTQLNFLPLMDNLVNSTTELSIKDNRFICDCRLAWLFDLKNATKNEDLRYSLQQLQCTLDKSHIQSHLLHNTIVNNNINFNNNNNNYNTRHRNDDRLYYDDIDVVGGGVSSATDHMTVESSDTGLFRPNEKTNFVHLFKLHKDILPCPEEFTGDPTELPLSRESIGLDLSWLSAASSSSSSPSSSLSTFFAFSYFYNTMSLLISTYYIIFLC